jgi:hypothetical protein
MEAKLLNPNPSRVSAQMEETSDWIISEMKIIFSMIIRPDTGTSPAYLHSGERTDFCSGMKYEHAHTANLVHRIKPIVSNVSVFMALYVTLIFFLL